MAFVDDFSGWENRYRISIAQLHYYLQDKKHLKYEPLKSYVAERVAKYESGNIYPSSIDKKMHELQYLSVIEHEIAEFTYAALLYKFRCSVVHEFNTPGHAMDGFGDGGIVYHSMMHYENGSVERTTWELLFSNEYISKIVEVMIDNAKKYCIKNEINPYEYYYFGDVWGGKKRNKSPKQKQRAK